MMPLDSTQIHLQTEARESIFSAGNPITDQLTLLYHQWVANTPNHSPTPTLFDPVAAAYTFRPELCPMTPMRIEMDEKGLTRKVEGQPNAHLLSAGRGSRRAGSCGGCIAPRRRRR